MVPCSGALDFLLNSYCRDWNWSCLLVEIGCQPVIYSNRNLVLILIMWVMDHSSFPLPGLGLFSDVYLKLIVSFVFFCLLQTLMPLLACGLSLYLKPLAVQKFAFVQFSRFAGYFLLLEERQTE